MATEKDGDVARAPPYPLYGTSFTLYRSAPLYHGPTVPTLLDKATLDLHARRFRDVLRGEVLRGVRVGLAEHSEDGLGRAGGLVDCSWTILGDEGRWIEVHTHDKLDEVATDEARGIHVQVVYEKNTYMAMLLRTPSVFGLTDTDGFTHLPLLLTRMPVSLRETLLEYLASTFDTRVSALTLGSGYLESCLQAYLEDLTSSSADQGHTLTLQEIESIVRDVQLTLSLQPPAAPALRSIDITIARQDVLSFLGRGETVQAPNGKDVPAGKIKAVGPFMTAVSEYVQTHLGLSILHRDVSVSRVGCGAFMLGAEGKIKIARPLGSDDAADPVYRATNALVANLVKRAKDGLMPGEVRVSREVDEEHDG